MTREPSKLLASENFWISRGQTRQQSVSGVNGYFGGTSFKRSTARKGGFWIYCKDWPSLRGCPGSIRVDAKAVFAVLAVARRGVVRGIQGYLVFGHRLLANLTRQQCLSKSVPTQFLLWPPLPMSQASTDLFTKHEFLIRRLHSLSGLIPVGAYMTVHLIVNASLLNGAGAFQKNVNQIHSLGAVLPLVEWLFIFLPLIFHAAIGVWIIRTGKSNHDNYRYVANWRYTLQRWSGVIAVVFIFFHVFHLHGWFHSDWWLKTIAEPWGMAQFRPYNAASTLASAMGGFLWPIFYFVGVVACVFHLANGIWTMGITWGVWISPAAQHRASLVCAAGGVLLGVVGLSALFAVKSIDPDEAKAIEDKMYNAAVESGEMVPNPHKRSDHTDESEDSDDEDGDSDESEAAAADDEPADEAAH